MLCCSIQLSSHEGEGRDARLQRADAYLQGLLDRGQRPVQIMFPELWANGFFHFDGYHTQAEGARGETYERMSAWARRLGCYLHTGSFVEREGEDYYNTSLLLGPQGQLVGKYRKRHLFSYQSRETELLTPGQGVTVVDTEYGRVGLSTCYDLRFPEFFRAMVDGGAGWFLVTSAWPLARLEHWKLFNQVRAVEDQSFLLSCNGTGTLGGVQLGGHSMAVDPWGTVLAMGDDREGVVLADLDPGQIEENRARFPALRDRRPV